MNETVEGKQQNLRQLLTAASERLASTSPSARADAEILLAHCLQKPRSYLFTWPEKEVGQTLAAEFTRLVDARERGVPVAHLTGFREFWTLNLKVTPDTLIPRPETELLVETALTKLAGKQVVLDLGTGTGAIALALACEVPALHIIAADIFPTALAVAKENAQAHAIRNVQFILSDWFDALPAQRFDLIVSNPPYIEVQDPHLAQGDVRFEPPGALVSGDDGLHDIRRIIQDAPQWLANGGWLLLEHGYNQGLAVTGLLCSAGFQAVRCLPDLAGNDRVSLGQWLAV
ncbi:peptide chain release factor N(5)-glutamine methyltransferase [Candidatus Thiothrix sp. Deng01]|uniref:Release factor glutamine methyltransferase n=1 Tax=Candidatus Thiothrix phosphatis TaxID=3112415 RepID=A0ABU6D0M2_9GAMM|nr:peptide chain release factor N(5)-glutamine methyltransferase [Candidatus Thiothrix sp. Deng01]MEB4592386.1 peptide chain release factor N(5)-glutamine methyltransferase [Candidatus Thiothrix sp. Deng01]